MFLSAQGPAVTLEELSVWSSRQREWETERVAMMKYLLLALTVLVPLGFAACGDDSDDDDGDWAPYIAGQVTDIGRDDDGAVGSVFVQGDIDAFFLRVDDDTEVFRVEDGEQVSGSRDDLALGQQVEASVVGAVNPSEPPQGNAGRIVITGGLPESPDIRGEITSVTLDDGEVSAVLVEGEIESDTSLDKASLRVDEETAVYRLQDGEWASASREDLAEGQSVEAWTVGPIAESYPVQAYAGQIVILAE